MMQGGSNTKKDEKTDYQLDRALDILRAMSVMAAQKE